MLLTSIIQWFDKNCELNLFLRQIVRFWSHKDQFSDETLLSHCSFCNYFCGPIKKFAHYFNNASDPLSQLNPKKARHNLTPSQGTPGPGSLCGVVHNACFPGGGGAGGQCSPVDAVSWPRLVLTTFSCPTFRLDVPSLLLLCAEDTAKSRQAERSRRKTEPWQQTDQGRQQHLLKKLQ